MATLNDQIKANSIRKALRSGKYVVHAKGEFGNEVVITDVRFKKGILQAQAANSVWFKLVSWYTQSKEGLEGV